MRIKYGGLRPRDGSSDCFTRSASAKLIALAGTFHLVDHPDQPGSVWVVEDDKNSASLKYFRIPIPPAAMFERTLR